MMLGHERAQRMYPLAGVVCEACGDAPAVERHHKDHNSNNNSRRNVALLCATCHHQEHPEIPGIGGKAKAGQPWSDKRRKAFEENGPTSGFSGKKHSNSSKKIMSASQSRRQQREHELVAS